MGRTITEVPDQPAGQAGTGALFAENRRLQANLSHFTEQAARNESVLRKTQERELELLRARSLPQLLERMIHGLKLSHQLDVVTLALHDPQHEIRHLLSP